MNSTTSNTFLTELNKLAAEKPDLIPNRDAFIQGVTSELGWSKTAQETLCELRLVKEANTIFPISDYAVLEALINKQGEEARKGFTEEALTLGKDAAWVEGFLKEAQAACQELMEKEAFLNPAQIGGGLKSLWSGAKSLMGAGKSVLPAMGESRMGLPTMGNPESLARGMGQNGQDGASIAQSLQGMAHLGVVPKTSIPMQPASVQASGASLFPRQVNPLSRSTTMSPMESGLFRKMPSDQSAPTPPMQGGAAPSPTRQLPPQAGASIPPTETPPGVPPSAAPLPEPNPQPAGDPNAAQAATTAGGNPLDAQSLLKGRNWWDLGGHLSDLNQWGGNKITGMLRSNALRPVAGDLKTHFGATDQELQSLDNGIMPPSLSARHPNANLEQVLTQKGILGNRPGGNNFFNSKVWTGTGRPMRDATLGAIGGSLLGPGGTIAGGLGGLATGMGARGLALGGGAAYLGSKALGMGTPSWNMDGGASPDSSGMAGDRNRLMGGMSNNFLGMIGGAAMLPYLVKGTPLEGIPTPLLMMMGGYGGEKLLPYLMNKYKDPEGMGVNRDAFSAGLDGQYGSGSSPQQLQANTQLPGAYSQGAY